MTKRQKNPLYVVKGNKVEKANNLLDLAVKKLNLEPLIEILSKILNILIKSVKNYTGFILVKDFLDFILSKINLFKKYSII